VSRSARLLFAAVLVGAATAAAISGGDGKARLEQLYPSAFPAGDGQALANRFCQSCHSVSLTTQQAKDSTGWEKTLVQMEKWGVQATPAEHATLHRYLLAHYRAKAKKR
jgi:hypothetical protein